MTTQLKLQKLDINNGISKAEYLVSHSTPGREGTTLSESIVILFDEHGAESSIKITQCKAPTPDASLAKLSDWLKRITQAIDQRSGSTLPLC